MNIDGIEKTIWDENILFYRILKWLIQSKVKSSVLFYLQVLIERNKNKNLDSKSWYELIISVLNYKTNGESNNISELLLTNNKNVNNFIIFLDFAISLFQLKELLWEEVKTFTNSRFVKKISSINDPLWMGYTLLDTNYIDKWTKKGTIIMANINSYTDEFKKQIVALYQSGKSVSCLVKEYNVTRAATYNWIKQFTNSGSFKTKDNRSVEENELIKLRKELKQLRMENDILKQAALIIGRK